MLEVLACILFIWLMFKAVGLTFKLTWGVAKVAASILMVVALPVLVVCMVFIGGLALLIPIAMISVVVGIVKACS